MSKKQLAPEAALRFRAQREREQNTENRPLCSKMTDYAGG